MSTNTTPVFETRDEIEAAIAGAGTIGALERLAGIEDRAEFWLCYRHIPGVDSIDAGAAELKRRIRSQWPINVAATLCPVFRHITGRL